MVGEDGWLLAPEREEEVERRREPLVPLGTASMGPWSLLPNSRLVERWGNVSVTVGQLLGAESIRVLKAALSTRVTMGALEASGADTVSRSETLAILLLLSTLSCGMVAEAEDG